jgi:hypothetical protein
MFENGKLILMVRAQAVDRNSRRVALTAIFVDDFIYCAQVGADACADYVG